MSRSVLTHSDSTRTYYVYILECANGSYYTGMTTDLERRYQEHCAGSAKCKYTRSFPPVKIAASWEFMSETSSLALKLEKCIKQLKKSEKLKLIKKEMLLNDLLQPQEKACPHINFN